MAPAPFTWEVRNVGVKVAALMTPEIIRRRIGALGERHGGRRCRAAARATSRRSATQLGVPVRAAGRRSSRTCREFFGGKASRRDLTGHDCRIFAEIVEALGARASRRSWPAPPALRAEGADVIDLGCLPDTPFPHLEEAVQALKAQGSLVSVDSGDPAELRRGARAGADFLLSLNEDTLDLAFETDAVPVLIPARHGELDGLVPSLRAAAAGRPAVPGRPDPRPDPFRLHRPRSCATTSCGAACPRPRC